MPDAPPQFGFFDPKQEYSVTYGTLPHWEQRGATYFITYRTNDSIPKAAFDLWQRERDDALQRMGIDPNNPAWSNQFNKLNWETKRQFHRQYATNIEFNLDELNGSCPLRSAEASAIVAENLRHFDGERYSLGGFVVMPNHVHVLVCFRREVSLLDQCKNWKHFQSREINKLLGLNGRVWQAESFDHLVRDLDHFHKFRKYIEDNPTKASLSESEYRLYLPDLTHAQFAAD